MVGLAKRLTEEASMTAGRHRREDYREAVRRVEVLSSVLTSALRVAASILLVSTPCMCVHAVLPASCENRLA